MGRSADSRPGPGDALGGRGTARAAPREGGLRGPDAADSSGVLRDVRDFANPDPGPNANSPALPDEGDGYIGAFGRKENWLDGWTVFGPESVYGLR